MGLLNDKKDIHQAEWRTMVVEGVGWVGFRRAVTYYSGVAGGQVTVSTRAAQRTFPHHHRA